MLTLLVLGIVAPGPGPAKDDPNAFDWGQGAPDPVRVRTVWQVDQVRPGDQVVLAVVASVERGYHINADQAQLGEHGDFEPWPTSITVTETAPELTVETPRFPEPHPFKVMGIPGELMTFDGDAAFFLPMKVAETAAPGSELDVALTFEYQACDSVACLMPQTVNLSASIPVAEPGAAQTKLEPHTFLNVDNAVSGGAPPGVAFDLFGLSFSIDTASGAGFALLLLTAMLGGFLLNLTPCVLPVIPIKIMSLGNVAEHAGRRVLLGVVMSLGVIGFWLALGVLISSVSTFTATNQLFQYPAFTIGVGLVIAVMAVGMAGFFTVNLPTAVYAMNPSQETLHGSFGFGVMTAILSTPCTAPFMGAAAAWAATQQAGLTLATFAAIGVGMALPYLVLSVFPALVKKMPRTGPASELIKQVMGLLMLAAAAYFVGTGLSGLLSEAPDPPSKGYWWVVMGFVAAAGGWLLVRTVQISRGAANRIVFGALGLALMAGSAYAGRSLTGSGPVNWVHYTPQRLDTALAQGNVVVMDFTAEWCLNCKSLEHTVLQDPRVVTVLNGDRVVPMKVDITGKNPAGKAKLKETGRLTIPLLVVYDPDGREHFKSDFYTVDQVLQAVDRARPQSGDLIN